MTDFNYEAELEALEDLERREPDYSKGHTIDEWVEHWNERGADTNYYAVAKKLRKAKAKGTWVEDKDYRPDKKRRGSRLPPTGAEEMTYTSS
jgi:hypothetical protein